MISEYLYCNIMHRFLIQFCSLLQMETSKCILNLLNKYTFNHTAQIILSHLDQSDLQKLLNTIEKNREFQQLSQLVRGRIIVLLAQKNDRTIYYTFFQSLPLIQLKQQRGNLLSITYSKKELNFLLQSYSSLVQQGIEIYAQQFNQIKQCLLQPSLALPPVKRQTVAPNCQTIYQITLAFQKLRLTMEQENNFVLNEKTTEFVLKCLAFQIQIAYFSINSLVDDLQHCVQLSYRFMVYRNTVLSFHSMCRFTNITTTMKLWTSRMSGQYMRANQVYLKLLEIKPIQENKFGLFTFDDLKQQSFMLDYVQSLVDQSVNEDDVAFCGHSKIKFRGLYATLQTLIVEWVKTNNNQIKATLSPQQIQKTIQKWLDYGLKPATLTKVIRIFNEFLNSDELDREFCCRDDYFIENCGRINGLSLNDSSQFHLQCF